MLAAHRKIEDGSHREEVARFWGVKALSEKPGLTALEMVEALERDMDAEPSAATHQLYEDIREMPRFELKR